MKEYLHRAPEHIDRVDLMTLGVSTQIIRVRPFLPPGLTGIT